MSTGLNATSTVTSTAAAKLGDADGSGRRGPQQLRAGQQRALESQREARAIQVPPDKTRGNQRAEALQKAQREGRERFHAAKKPMAGRVATGGAGYQSTEGLTESPQRNASPSQASAHEDADVNLFSGSLQTTELQEAGRAAWGKLPAASPASPSRRDGPGLRDRRAPGLSPAGAAPRQLAQHRGTGAAAPTRLQGPAARRPRPFLLCSTSVLLSFQGFSSRAGQVCVHTRVRATAQPCSDSF